MPGLDPGIHSVAANPRRYGMDGRVKCSAREHSRHVFGDMADTFLIGQVDCSDLVGAEVDAIATICGERSDGESLAGEGSRDFKEAALEADIVFGGGDGADDRVLVVIDL